jgi:hypothetical protein
MKLTREILKQFIKEELEQAYIDAKPELKREPYGKGGVRIARMQFVVATGDSNGEPMIYATVQEGGKAVDKLVTAEELRTIQQSRTGGRVGGSGDATYGVGRLREAEGQLKRAEQAYPDRNFYIIRAETILDPKSYPVS